MPKVLPLSELPLGCRAAVKALSAQCSMRRRLLDIGLVEHAEVCALYRSPSGDPTAYSVCGTVIALRAADAAQVLVEPLPHDHRKEDDIHAHFPCSGSPSQTGGTCRKSQCRKKHRF